MGDLALAVFHMAHPAGEGVRCGATGDALDVTECVPGDDGWRDVVTQVCPECMESFDFRVSTKVAWEDYKRPCFYAEVGDGGGYWHTPEAFRRAVVDEIAPHVDTAEQFLARAPGYVWAVAEIVGVITDANASDVAHMVMEEAFGNLPENAQEDLSPTAFAALADALRKWSAEHASNVKTYGLELGTSVVLGPAFWAETIEELGLV